MKSVILGLALAFTLQIPAVAADDQSSARPVVDSLTRFVDQVNAGDQKSALEHFTPDAAITDDIAPYRWQGQSAGSDWMAAMWANGQRTGMTEISMHLARPTRVEVEGDRAYAVIPGVLTLKGKGRAIQANGLLTIALQRTGTDWRIGSLAWGGEQAKP